MQSIQTALTILCVSLRMYWPMICKQKWGIFFFRNYQQLILPFLHPLIPSFNCLYELFISISSYLWESAVKRTSNTKSKHFVWIISESKTQLWSKIRQFTPEILITKSTMMQLITISLERNFIFLGISLSLQKLINLLLQSYWSFMLL